MWKEDAVWLSNASIAWAVLSVACLVGSFGSGIAQQAPITQKQVDAWMLSVSKHFLPLAKHPDLSLPCGAARGGTLLVSFNIDRTGRILSARIVKPSGSRTLDRAALAMVTQSSPVPAPPASLPESKLNGWELPVTYRSRCHTAEP